MADFGGDDLEAFRAEAREWLEANFPKALAADPAAQVAKMSGAEEGEDARAWRKRFSGRNHDDHNAEPGRLDFSLRKTVIDS